MATFKENINFNSIGSTELLILLLDRIYWIFGIYLLFSPFPEEREKIQSAAGGR